jgi:PAS domain S-box-containing protein
MQDPIWGIDVRSYRFVDANAAALAFLGYSEEELSQKGLADVHTAEGIKSLLSRCAPSASPEFADSSYDAGVLSFKKKDGSTETLQVRCFVIKFTTEHQWLYLQGKGRTECPV